MVTTIDKMDFKSKVELALSSIPRTVKYNLDIKEGRIKPKFLLNIVTWQCNSNCIMCNISRRQDGSKFLTLEEYEKILCERNFWKDLRGASFTGGEPFLRNDLKDIIFLFIENCPSLERIYIPTNGFMTKKIVSTVKEILDGTDIRVDIGVSLDGLGKTHDKIRGIDGAFSMAIKTINELKKLEQRKENFSLLTECVVSKANYKHVNELRKFQEKNGIPLGLEMLSFQESYYKNIELKDQLSLSKREIKHVFNGSHFLDYFIIKQLKTGRRQLPCSSGFGSFSLNPEGDVYLCHLLDSAGNVKDKSLQDIWMSKKARKMRSIIKKGDICNDCFFRCDILFTSEYHFFYFMKLGMIYLLHKFNLLKHFMSN